MFRFLNAYIFWLDDMTNYAVLRESQDKEKTPNSYLGQFHKRWRTWVVTWTLQLVILKEWTAHSK